MFLHNLIAIDTEKMIRAQPMDAVIRAPPAHLVASS
jgi:hypothetical protein